MICSISLNDHILVELEVYMANALQLSLRRFVQHHTFLLIAFGMLVHNHVATSIYVHYKVHPINVAQATIISRENLALQV
jgi:hypothetical protein